MATIEELQAQIAALSARVDALTVPPNRYYSSRYTGETIDKLLTSISGGAANLDLSNLTDYQRALHNIGGRPNRNLFDNGYLVGGGTPGNFPINQKNISSPQDGQSIADRWKSASGDTTYSLDPDGLLCSGGISFISQKAEDYLYNYLQGKRITISALWLDNYLFSHTWKFDKNQQELANGLFVYTPDLGFILPRNIGVGNQKTMMAAKLEVGDKQTLAYQDSSGNWQLFETPNYVEELARCQRHYVEGIVQATIDPWPDLTFLSGTTFPVEMAKLPVLKIFTKKSGEENKVNDLNGIAQTPLVVETYPTTKGIKAIRLDGSLETTKSYSYYYTASTGM